MPWCRRCGGTTAAGWRPCCTRCPRGSRRRDGRVVSLPLAQLPNPWSILLAFAVPGQSSPAGLLMSIYLVNQPVPGERQRAVPGLGIGDHKAFLRMHIGRRLTDHLPVAVDRSSGAADPVLLRALWVVSMNNSPRLAERRSSSNARHRVRLPRRRSSMRRQQAVTRAPPVATVPRGRATRSRWARSSKDPLRDAAARARPWSSPARSARARATPR
jgi:hypothetical protein